MADMAFDIDKIKKKMLIKYPYFGSTISSVQYQIVGGNHRINTAATDGKTIYVNADFMSTLSEDKQVFIMAHEVCHIALNHIQRSKGKNHKLWNIATDGVINQHLKKDGLPMPEGVVDIADAIKLDAEELYQKLLAEKNQQQEQNDGGDQENSQVGHDDHSMWEEATKQKEQKEQGNDKSNLGNQNQSQDTSEKEIFEKNNEEKVKRAEDVMRKINGIRRGLEGQTQEVCFENIGKAKSVTNWKKMLKKALELEDEAWGHKFSDKASGYAARIEDVEYDDKSETEIILDTSGSVSVDLLKNFLRQVKNLLKDSAIKIGTFNSRFNGFVEIKNESDIDHLKIEVGGGTNFDAASSAFTKRKDVNKICFTDGQDSGNAGIKDKRRDIVWISFGNPKFKPDYGKVIYVPKSQLDKVHGNCNELSR